MKLLPVLGAVLLTASPAAADIVLPLTISGNGATASVSLPGGLGADLGLSFENVVGLNPAALDVSVSVVLPLLDPILKRILASGGRLPVALPLVFTIEPSAASTMSFQGVASINLHTHNLVLNTLLPLSLFAASNGGPFRDITRSEGIGSYRVGGSTGGFSEFVIVLDLRRIDPVIRGKFDALTALLNTHAASIEPATLEALETRLAAARAHYNAGALVAAIAEVSAFGADVQAASGVGIPDVWRANDPLVNVAGKLRSGADTLKFSLARKQSSLLQ
jgi:hypothetical protein